ncbi:MAG: hypothetical protein JSS30_05685 [Verrucomicrobia bacterium]|nr:hypothetical protein [Verrucomicrobiota bacterium]
MDKRSPVLNTYIEWNILDTGVGSAEENMRLDAELLETLDSHALPILHFYEWDGDCATYGHFVNPADFLHLEEAKKRGLNLAKRPTGGGIVFHIWDLAFSVLIPSGHPYFSENTLDNYAFVNTRVLAAVKNRIGKNATLIPENAPASDVSCTRFCMAQPTKYDVVLNGRKIAGAAQRKTKKGFLHQGTIALQMPSEEYLKPIVKSAYVLEGMMASTFPLQVERRILKSELENQFVCQIKQQ